MQVGLLAYPHWLIGLAVLIVAMLAKGTLAFCEALAKKSRANGGGGKTLPNGLEKLAKPSPQRETLRLGESCCGVVVSVVAFLFLWDLAGQIDSFPGMALKIALAMTLAGLTAIFQHVSTVSLPGMLALKASPNAWRKVFWAPMLLGWITSPVRFLIKVKVGGMRHLLGVEKEKNEKDGLRAEIEALDDESSDGHSSGIRQIVGNTLQLQNLDAQDILLPRNQVQILDLNDPLEKNLALAKSWGHTRFPLCDGDLDHCVGIVHVKDVFREISGEENITLAEIKRDFATFSPDDPLAEVLQKMLRSRLHMALVRDEFGGAVGILTLEDALEEVVGEIKDEFDVGEEDPIRKLADGSYFVTGLAQTHEVKEMIGTSCGNDEISSFGGWITMALGRIPEEGESFDLGNLAITVEKADGVRIIETKVKPLILDKAPASESS